MDLKLRSTVLTCTQNIRALSHPITLILKLNLPAYCFDTFTPYHIDLKIETSESHDLIFGHINAL